MTTEPTRDVLDRFSPATREWFSGAFAEPTTAQVGAWDAISSGSHALVVAPTGSGKTLAAFLWSIDRLIADPIADVDPRQRTRVLYISPLKALGVDVERNLRAPLVGVTQTAKRLGMTAPAVTVGVRSGDTSTQDRRLLARTPPDILITTPESLYLMLTSAARETLLGIDTIIVDEIHAVAATKRGAHLAVSLERLDALLPKPAQRIGLSATVRPREEVARFLGGRAPVIIVAPPSGKRFDLTVVVPVDDMSELGTAPQLEGASEAGGNQGSIWPHVEERILDLILEHRSTIVFANSRRLAERLTGRLNEIYEERAVADDEVSVAEPASPEPWPGRKNPVPPRTRPLPELFLPGQGLGNGGRPEHGLDTLAELATRPTTAGLLARAHHGSVSKDQRAIIEDDLKSGRLRCVVATSSLELGIDMGEVDLVVQVESPPSVASGLQRVGRAGHQVGEVSRGVLFPKHRADLIHTAVVSERMVEGAIEALAIPQNPLDILAQQTVAAVALEPLDIEAWWDTLRKSAPFATLPRGAYEATLDLLSGLYPSDEFAELRPRIVWDRVNGTLTGRPGAQRLAVTSGGTIPDRGLFGVFMVGAPSTGSGTGGGRVGELDEEMVYESRVGDVFALGTTSWRIEDITHDRVLVSPAYGQPGRVPFWKGDGLGRPAELGAAIGAFIREVSASGRDAALERAVEPGGSRQLSRDAGGEEAKPNRLEGPVAERLHLAGLDDRAVVNLVAFIEEQKVATGHVPTDRTLVIERFRDELGDWRVVLHSPYGMQVHSPWALAVTARVRERFGYDGAAVAADDGIIVRLPDTDADPPGAELFVFESAELEQLVTDEVGGSALFAARFRECAARALLLPRYNPGKRSPLWQQRQRASQLLEVARKYPSFPIVLETVREVLQDVYDLPALMAVTAEIAKRSIRLVEAETEAASPFARSLLFGYVAAFMYEGDSPLAERRATALSLDPTLLAELLGRAELRELLDPKVLETTELELQRLAPDRRARGLEGVVDLLRALGPLSSEEIVLRWSSSNSAERHCIREVEDSVGRGTSTRIETSSPEAGASDERSEGLDTLAELATRPAEEAELATRPPEEAELATRPAEDAELAGILGQLERSHRILPTRIAGYDRWAIIEDASRLRDALGVPLPIGVPAAFIEPVADPVGDLISRYARTHGPFAAVAVADRFGLGIAVVLDSLRRLGSERRVVEGEFRPGATGSEWVDAEILRRLRSRSLAALRHEVEPVSPDTLGRFLPVWQHVGSTLKGIDGLVQVIDQLGGVALPASAWETLVLPARLRDYSQAWLDELTVTGEVLWSGAGALPGSDGWVGLHLAESAPLTLAAPQDIETTALQREILVALAGGGAYFFRQLGAAVGSSDDGELATAIWDLVWAGLVTNDTFSPLRSFLGGKSAPKRTPRTRAYRGRARPLLPTQSGPPTVGGRWSLLPLAEGDTTVRAKATAELLLERHGIVTRGAVVSEGIRGGFALAYKVLSTFEETGRARRGYFVEGLGGAQFATGATVDRLRQFSRDDDSDAPPLAITLAATDPANPYGGALAWPKSPLIDRRPVIEPARPEEVAQRPSRRVEITATGHRPGRKAGALVVLVDGFLTLYIERGGKTVLTFSSDERMLAAAATSLAATVRTGLGRLRIERVDGEFSIGTPLGHALADAGFAATPQGLRLRG